MIQNQIGKTNTRSSIYSTQDIAEAKKYDFIFDKSSDLTMLFQQKRFDISDQVYGFE
jgi:hypothetical protein